MTRFWSLLVLCLLAAPALLPGAPPVGRDGHELPLRPGPVISRGPDGPVAGPGPGPGTPAPAGPQALAGRFPVHGGVAGGHVVVRFRDEVPDWQRDAVSRGAGGRAHRPAEWAEFARVDVPEGRPVAEVLQALRSNPTVLWALTDPVYSGSGVSVSPRSHQPIDDPFFPLQWNLDRIRYHAALDLSTIGGRGLIVAVIDSGVASGSGGSFPARRGLDLEGVSFLSGMDFVDGGPAFDLGVAVGNEGPVNRRPRFGHGTFAAAQIAAGVNNGLAGAGIAPRVTILPVRILDPLNSTNASVVAEAVNFAVAAGADVINLSLGGSEGFEPLRQAVENAVRSGVVVVASAGNEAQDPEPPADVLFPARYEAVIAVGATGFDDGRAGYSNTGPGLDLMAPAGENPSLVRGSTRDAALAPSFLHDPVTGEVVYAGFFATGTSFAAPQVAAAAALLMALGVDDPETVRFVLEETARNLGAPGIDPETGHGLLDLLRAHQGLGFAS